MVGVTPVGVLTDRPSESKRFYKEVLGVDRVQFLKKVPSPDGGETESVLLRLESPHLEVFSVETRVMDRSVNKIVRRDYSLMFHPADFKNLLHKLNVEKIETKMDDRGHLHFEDINGIGWEVKTV